jgi:hypothetical protein
MSTFEKELYSEELAKFLSFDKSVFESLNADMLDDVFNAYEQLNNGYISPLLLQLNPLLQAEVNKNTLKTKNIEEAKNNEKKYNAFQKRLVTLISDTKNHKDLYAFMDKIDYDQIKIYIKGSMASLFEDNIYKVFEKGYTAYKELRNNLMNSIEKADVQLGSNKKSELLRNAIGIILIQEDLIGDSRFDTISKEKQSIVDYLLKTHDSGKVVGENDKIDLLKGAKNLFKISFLNSDGNFDINKFNSSKDEFFKENPKAKNLYDEIRKSIDNKIFPLLKISKEREGGYVSLRDNYFPIQRRGNKNLDILNAYDDMFSDNNENAKVKTLADALYSRTGDPIVMREFNATKAYNTLTDEIARTYALRPVYSPYYAALSDLADEYEANGDIDSSKFLRASIMWINESTKVLFNKKYSDLRIKINKAASLARKELLAQYYRLGGDYLAAIVKVLLSFEMTLQDSFKYMALSKKIDAKTFEKMAYLTRSPIIFKTSIGNIDAQYLNVIERQNRLDKIVGAAVWLPG